MDEESLEPVIIKPAIKAQAQAMSIPDQPPIDRIGNNKQKESALNKAGINRYKAFLFVRESLEAVIRTEYRDAQGNVKYKDSPDVKRREWAVEMIGKYYADFVTKSEGETNGIRQLVIIRPDAASGEATQAKAVSGQVCFQSEAVSRDVFKLGHGENNVIDISVNDVQRANT